MATTKFKRVRFLHHLKLARDRGFDAGYTKGYLGRPVSPNHRAAALEDCRQEAAEFEERYNAEAAGRQYDHAFNNYATHERAA